MRDRSGHTTPRDPADPKEGGLTQATFTSLSPGLDRASTENRWSCLFPPTYPLGALVSEAV